MPLQTSNNLKKTNLGYVLYQDGAVQPARDGTETAPFHVPSPVPWLWNTITPAEQESQKEVEETLLF